MQSCRPDKQGTRTDADKLEWEEHGTRVHRAPQSRLRCLQSLLPLAFRADGMCCSLTIWGRQVSTGQGMCSVACRGEREPRYQAFNILTAKPQFAMAA